jgi:hypothetical protein
MKQQHSGEDWFNMDEEKNKVRERLAVALGAITETGSLAVTAYNEQQRTLLGRTSKEQRAPSPGLQIDKFLGRRVAA